MTRLVPFLVVMLSAGCAAQTRTYGARASGGAPPPLPPGQQVPLHDHYCANLDPGRDSEGAFTRLLDAASAEGWEMVALDGERDLYCFKRPRMTPGPAPGAAEPPPPAP